MQDTDRVTDPAPPFSRRFDLLALSGSVLALAMATMYLVLVYQERGDPADWAVAILVGSGVGAGYSASRQASYRRLVLWLAAIGLMGLGYLAILTIGLPILLAGVLCLMAALRARRPKDWRDTV